MACDTASLEPMVDDASLPQEGSVKPWVPTMTYHFTLFLCSTSKDTGNYPNSGLPKELNGGIFENVQ